MPRHDPSPTGAPVQTLKTEPPQCIRFVEDDRELSAVLCCCFTKQGDLVEVAHGGPAMRRALSGRGFDLMVLEMGLPGREHGHAPARE
ncbi:response regulator [Paracoccus binzhouensis]|uniref:hypothetical protein n=1 Tax=Paracoccus binzhouensis TaxID=2796149 RepID=UPI0018EEE94C|nr:hypothetical protein [Paracoccus binzhouensis]